MKITKCFCDASYSPLHKFAIIGWQIGKNEINIQRINDTNNTRAELIAMIKLLKCLDVNEHYTIFTDCQGIIRSLNKKEKIVEKKFKNNRGKELANADLYRKLYDLFLPNISIVHISGHIPTKLMNNDNENFSRVDKLVRSVLREHVNRSNKNQL
jgi:ribonuclease HI